MNQIMIQQAVSTVRALQGKTANSAGHGQNALDFAAIARDALGTDAAATPEKSIRDETNPLAALLLAALFTQPQPTTDTDDSAADTQTQGQSNPAVDALTAQTAASSGTSATTENLVTLLQSLGMGQTEAQDFAQQLGAMLQTAQKATPNASPTGIAHAAQRSAVWAAAQQAAQQATVEATVTVTSANGAAAMGAAGAPGTDPEIMDPIAQVRHLLGKLLGESVVPVNTSIQGSEQQPDTKTVLTLRALLADLQAAQQTTSATAAANPQGDTHQDTTGSDDASSDTGAAMADTALLNAATATVAFPDLRTAGTAVPQVPRRTLNEAFDTMVDTITSLRNSDKSEMEIHLKPDFLGKVVIKLTMEEGSLVARISASSSSVQDAFQAQATQLTSSLQQSGIKDVTVLVTHDMASGSALDQSTARQQHNPREQRRRSWAVQDTTEKNDIARATAAYDQFWRNGTINYLA